jgi:outer membrane protein insertion porin family/translocation and assembly module TamA
LWVERERDIYDPNLVARDLERIERFYRARGYYDVKVVAARVESVGEREVEIEVRVTPGPRVVVRNVQEDAAALLGLPLDVASKYTKVEPIVAGAPFDEALLTKRKTNLENTLKRSGYAYAKVRVTATVDLNAHAADIVTSMQAGTRVRFGEIRIAGLKQIPEEKVRAALSLRQGQQYSDDDLDDARQALVAMQLFTRVEITPDLSNPTAPEVPILVALQEDQLRKLTLGGGTVVDALKFQVHLSTGWEHKNFLGGARRLAIDAKIGVDFFPWRLENFNYFAHTPNLFLVMDSQVTLEQPSIFNGRTKGAVSARYTRRPILYSLPADTDTSKETVIGYHQPSAQASLERGFVGTRINLKPSYNIQANLPFTYQNIPSAGKPNPNDVLQTVWVSYPRLEATFSTKPGDIFKDRAKREFTISFLNSLEIAGMSLGGTRIFGGSVSDVKIEPEIRGVAPIFAGKRSSEQKAGNLTVAARFKVGFILAPDYGSTLRSEQTKEDDPNVIHDQQKLLMRAFYSGGPSSNRGYAFAAISPHGPIGVLSTNADCVKDPSQERCVRPLGGFTQWETSLELRYAGLYPVTVVLFADAADVTRDIGRIQFKYPHLSVGPGLRYETPVGPIRLDVGFRVPGWQAIGESTLPLSHGQERPLLFGIPAAVNLAIGEAF